MEANRNVTNQEANKQIGFSHILWPPIVVVLKKYGTNFDDVNYLQIAYQSPKVLSPYEKLAKSNLWT